MKIELTKQWCLRMAALEEDAEISVGVLAADPSIVAEHVAEVTGEALIAFPRLVRLMRRNRHLSLEKLAEQIDVEIGELVGIEEAPSYRPEPRTVHLLAKYFDLPRGNLMQLAGLMEPKNDQLFKEAIRFAARSEPMADLSPEEKAALEAFVSVLSGQK